jgi:hypothetical protein
MIALSMPTYCNKGDVILVGHADGSLSTWQLELDHNFAFTNNSANNNTCAPAPNDDDYQQQQPNSSTNENNNNSSKVPETIIEKFRFVSSIPVHVPANLRTSAVQSESATKVTAIATNTYIVPATHFMIAVAFGDRQVQMLTTPRDL